MYIYIISGYAYNFAHTSSVFAKSPVYHCPHWLDVVSFLTSLLALTHHSAQQKLYFKLSIVNIVEFRGYQFLIEHFIPTINRGPRTHELVKEASVVVLQLEALTKLQFLFWASPRKKNRPSLGTNCRPYPT